MGASMTLIELIGGLSFVNKPVKLWDYSNRWGNYKGIKQISLRNFLLAEDKEKL